MVTSFENKKGRISTIFVLQRNRDSLFILKYASYSINAGTTFISPCNDDYELSQTHFAQGVY